MLIENQVEDDRFRNETIEIGGYFLGDFIDTYLNRLALVVLR